MSSIAEEPVSDGAETDFRLLAELSADVICRVGIDGAFLYVSPSSLRVLGWKPEEMMKMPPFILVHPDDLSPLTSDVDRIMAPGAAAPLTELRIRKRDGSYIWMEVSRRVVRDDSTEIPREVVLVMRDITERKKLDEKLNMLALTDSLTGLANRRAFDEALEREWRRTLREGSQMSLVLLDIDYFKELNDCYGHQVGDDCLRAVAAAIKGAVRASDIATRYGGDEIAVILPGADASGAREVARKVRAAVEALHISHGSREEAGGWVTASVGVATALARQGGTMQMPQSLLQAADNALYKAKHEGRNRVATALLVASKES
jgi:diguanylate cyclase (GGDEF)-like protein/PAS domain S-box-containing protein